MNMRRTRRKLPARRVQIDAPAGAKLALNLIKMKFGLR
jgi:hypothetical protein